MKPNFDLGRLYTKVGEFVGQFKPTITPVTTIKTVDEWTDCFQNNLYPFDLILRRAIPALRNGIHQIDVLKIRNQILDDLSKQAFLDTLWYRLAEGDLYVESLSILQNGHWLMSAFNWELDVAEMWVCRDVSLENEFILIKSSALPPFDIETDVGGKSWEVGVLNDGTIVSNNEYLNGFAVIGGRTINLEETKVQPRYRERNSHWVFIASDYHKIGYNPDQTIEFCKRLDSGAIEVNEKTLYNFIHKLRTNPKVLQYR